MRVDCYALGVCPKAKARACVASRREDSSDKCPYGSAQQGGTALRVQRRACVTAGARLDWKYAG